MLSRALTYVFYAGLLMLAVGWWFRDQLPLPEQVDASLFQPPLQQSVNRAPFFIDFHDLRYNVTPVASYAISGLVVSHNDPGKWWAFDLVHDEKSIDTRDLCVVWGGNIKPGLRQAKFWNNQWECRFSFKHDSGLNAGDVSNNHLIAAKQSIRDQIANLNIGDQIRIKGLLVNYHDPRNNFWRNTSLTRDDTENGACEVIFVEQLDVLKRGNPLPWFLYNTGWALLMAALGLKVLLFLIKP